MIPQVDEEAPPQMAMLAPNVKTHFFIGSLQ
jgi:hypothetical protein